MRSGMQWRLASTYLGRSGVVTALTVAVAFGCADDSEEARPAGIDEATLAAAPVETLDGLVRIADDAVWFRRCGRETGSRVIEAGTADLRESVLELVPSGSAAVRARLTGAVVAVPATGPDDGPETVVYVHQWTYLAEDGSGCAPAERGDVDDALPTPEEGAHEGEGEEALPTLPAGIGLRALGNEPFWNADVSTDRVRVGRLGFDDIVFERPAVATTDVARSWSGETGGHRFELTVEDGPCRDTMVDRVYPFRARLTLDGRTFQGCAFGRARTDGESTRGVRTGGAGLLMETARRAAEVESSLEGLPSIPGELELGDATSRFDVYYEAGRVSWIDASVDLGDYGFRRVRYAYADGAPFWIAEDGVLRGHLPREQGRLEARRWEAALSPQGEILASLRVGPGFDAGLEVVVAGAIAHARRMVEVTDPSVSP